MKMAAPPIRGGIGRRGRKGSQARRHPIPDAADARESVTSVFRIGRAEFFGLLVIVVSAMMIGWQTYEQYRGMRTQTVAFLQQLARTGEAHVDGSLRNVDSLLRDVVARIFRNGPTVDSDDAEFVRIRSRSYPEIRQVFLLDALGVVRFSTLPEAEGYNASDRPYYLEPKENADEDRLILTGPIQAVSGTILFAVSRAVRNADGSFAGAVVASLSPTLDRKSVV